MLQIQDIRKKYVAGTLSQTALDGVSLTLRESEFVAILGPSGSGKTTLLNIIGGLDRYDSGDLIINGISTKKYSDRDWDSYRNHTVGFVFQSYNLIPHQTILSNVELALTISGVPRSQRRKRAVKALEQVGLGSHLHKKPNQLSGGQMQRVAIARALVNNPSILLADEPTGALDSETSVQIMELLKEVSKDRLVVMVTHNPELAMDYASRIVRVKDGKIMDDTNPYEVTDSADTTVQHKNMGKSSMSFFSSLSLSFNNLRTKKARTLLTAFAGSIGIIGIALIMSLSSGFQDYIDQIQEDTLANYPLTIQSETANLSAFLMPPDGDADKTEETEPKTVSEQPMLSNMFALIGANDLAPFKAHLEDHYDEISHALNAVQYGYNIQPRIYADSAQVLQVNPSTLFDELLRGSSMAEMMNMDVFYEMVDNEELRNSQYQILEGRWPEAYNELVVVLPTANHLPDHIAYTLGLKDRSQLNSMVDEIMQGTVPEHQTEQPMEWSYEELMSMTFRLVSVPELYRYNEDYDVWEDLSEDTDYVADLVQKGEKLNVVGIVCPRDENGAMSMSPGVAYHPDLTKYVIDAAAQTQIVQSQLSNPKVDVFSGTEFESQQEGKELNFEEMISVDGDAISSAFGMDVDESSIIALLESYMDGALDNISVDTSAAQQDFINTLSDFSRKMLLDFIDANADASAKLYLEDANSMAGAFLQTSYAQERLQQLSQEYTISVDALTQVYQPLLEGLVTTCVAQEISEELPASASEDSADNAAESEPVTASETVTEPHAEVRTVALTTEDTNTTEDSQPNETVSDAETLDETIPSETVPSETVPGETGPSETVPHETIPDETVPDGTLPPDVTLPDVPPDITLPDVGELYAEVKVEDVTGIVESYLKSPVVAGAASVMSKKMMQATVMEMMVNQLAGFTNVLADYLGSSFYVNEEKLSGAFQFNLDEEELRVLLDAISGQNKEKSAESNLAMLGYANLDNPTSMSIYMVDFAAKEDFLNFLDDYNQSMAEQGQEDQVIRYTDTTGIMMESVRTIIDSIGYVLIAFVAVSLLVSSIMIGIITYISVMERTKEIGVLRAMGASKRNISQVFNAETYIIGLISGLLGIGITLLLLIPGNCILHSITGSAEITARLPILNAVVLIVISILLTLLGGLIPAKQAAKKDPVIALRSE